MIDQNIILLAKEFADTSNLVFGSFNRYVFDFTWPSISILDRLLTPLKNKSEFSNEELFLIKQISAYIGGFIHDVWAYFPGTINIDLKEDKDTGDIIIKTYGAHLAPRRAPYVLNITASLKTIYSNTDQPIPVFADFTHPTSPHENRIAHFVFSAASGLSPFGEGNWTKETPEQMQDQIAITNTLLASTSAQHYRALNPQEALGAEVPLYLSNLIFPPTGYNESSPFLISTKGLIEYFKENNIPSKDIYPLAINLALSPDDKISSTGLATAIALAQPDKYKTLRYIIDSKREARFRVRLASILARHWFRKNADWTILLQSNEHHDEANKLFLEERELNLLPLLRLSFETCKNRNFAALVQFLVWGYPQRARDFIDSLINSDSVGLELILQSIFLSLLLGDDARAEYDLAQISSLSLGPSSPYYSLYNECMGLLSLHKTDDKAASAYLEDALNTNKDSLSRAGFIIEHLAQCFLSQGKFSDVLELIKDASSYESVSLVASIYHYLALIALDKKEEAGEALSALVRKSPFDQRVFNLVLSSRIVMFLEPKAAETTKQKTTNTEQES